MTTTPRNTPVAPAEQAKALLADAAREDRFYDPSSYDQDPRYALREGDDAATAMYAAQAATAHAMLAVTDELAGLRAELRQAVGAPREDLAQLASAVRGLAAAVATSAAQDTDVAGALRELTRTLADRMDGQTDQVLAVKDVVEDGLADITDVLEARRGGWWSRLLWWRISHRATRPGLTPDSDAAGTDPEADVEVDTAPAIALPVLHDSQRAQEALTVLQADLQNGSPALDIAGQAWNAREAVVDTLVRVQALPERISKNGAVQDAVLLLAASLEAVGPAHQLSVAGVREVSERLAELVQAVASASLATPLTGTEVA
ncbi:hypothetical protein [Nonomuraea sp. NPDC001699]